MFGSTNRFGIGSKRPSEKPTVCLVPPKKPPPSYDSSPEIRRWLPNSYCASMFRKRYCSERNFNALDHFVRFGQFFEIVGDFETKSIAVLELNAEGAFCHPRLEQTVGQASELVHAHRVFVLSNESARCRPGAEAQLTGVPSDVGAPHVPGFRVEVFADPHVFKNDAVAIATVLELCPIAFRAAAQPRRMRIGDVRVDVQILEE